MFYESAKYWIILSYIEYELKKKHQKLLVVQKIAACAKITKHCEIANATYRWYVLSCLVRRHSDDDSPIFNAVIQCYAVHFFNAWTGFYVRKEISHTGINLSVRAIINQKKSDQS